MKFIWCFLLAMFVSISSLDAQNTMGKDSFNDRYVEVIVSLVATDIHAAHRVADSLRNIANTDEQKIKAHMLLAKIFENQGDMQACIYSGMQADTIANVAMNFSWQSNTAGFLATAFRQIGLLGVSQTYLERAENANERQEDKTMQSLTRINIAHERVFHQIEEGDFEEARQYAKQAATTIDISDNEDKGALLVKATNDQLMGVCEFHLGNWSEASVFLDRALTKIGTTESNLIPYIYRMQAEVALAQNKSKEAEAYLLKVEPYLNSGGVEELKMLTYSTWAKFYDKSGDLRRSAENRAKYAEIKATRDKVAKQLSDELIMKLHSTKQAYRTKYIYAVGGILFVLAASTFGMLYVCRRKNIYKLRCKTPKEVDVAELSINVDNKLKDSVKKMVASQTSDITMMLDKVDSSIIVKPKDVAISKDTELRLCEHLDKLEKENFYLEKGITLNQLASKMGTNPRYVTYVIQTHKEKDFYSYVQTKRIEYILYQLQHSPDLLGFKLSYLADVCGFTSLSKFSTAFKEVTGMPPSAYVHLLKREQDDKS